MSDVLYIDHRYVFVCIWLYVLRFKLIALLIGSALPFGTLIMTNNEVAAGIFFVVGVILCLPFPIPPLVAALYGAFSSGPWYVPVLQVIVFELAWFIVNFLFTLVLGTSVSIVAVGEMLLEKLDWTNFKGVIGRKIFFIRMLCVFVGLAITGFAFGMFYSQIMTILSIGIFIFLLLCMYSTYAKRLHDLGLPGYLCLVILAFNMLTKDYHEFNLIVTIIIMCAFCFIEGSNKGEQ